MSATNKRVAVDDFGGFEGKKKRKSRWQDTDTEKNILAGLPTVIPTGLSKEQEEQYLLQLQIEEITRRLRTGELGIPSNVEDRSPSPEPIYSNEGKRLNTREYRTRKKLEEERHALIQHVMKDNPDYKPPVDYRPPLIRVSDKVLIPQDEHPELNFVGLLIGPRGNTLKNLEKETGASIIIRGKGSVKEGKLGHKDGRPLPGQDEPLHAYITANNPENVKKAVDRIKDIIKEGISVPDAENDLRKQQLRELALLNGTLRENDALTKLKQLQQAQTIITNTILCTICGGAGHIAQDCKQRRPGDSLKAMVSQSLSQNMSDRTKMDSEYLSLMAELGEAPPTTMSFGIFGSVRSQSSSAQPKAISSSPWNPGPVPPPPPPPQHTSTDSFIRNPSIQATAPPPPPPWQQFGNNSNFTSGSNGLGSSILPPPPPPPPMCTSQSSLPSGGFPWQQQGNGPSSMSGVPWQQQQQQQQGASVRPLMGISVVPPWQLQGSSSTAQPASQTGYQYSGNTPNLSSFYGGLSMPPPPPPS